MATRIVLAMAMIGWISLIVPVAAENQTQQTTEVKERVTTVRETVTTVKETEEKKEKAPRLAAIFIKNRAGRDFDDKVQAMEDLVTAAVTDMGFQVLSQEDTIKSVRSYLGLKPEDKLPGEKLDEVLDSRTSALRLAQNMNADYLLIASLTTYGQDKQKLNRPDLGIHRQVVNHKLRVTYKILDGAKGESLSSGTISTSRKVQESQDLQEDSNDVVNDLMADAADQIAARLAHKGGVASVPDPRKAEAGVEFAIVCGTQDLSVPEVYKDEKGQYLLGAGRYRLEPMDVTVELDGVTIGSTPGPLQALPGLHKMRLSREGFKDWERTINIRKGLNLNVALTFSDKGRDQWLRMAQFLSNLKQGEKLTDAQVEAIQGFAQMMRQSGLRVDRRSDIKVNTDKPPVFQQNNIDQQNVQGSIWP